MQIKSLIAAGMICLLGMSYANAENIKPHQPGKKDKCPVCGMFVYKYPDWVTEIVYRDGSAVFFDGAKDLFKYLFNLRKYESTKTQNDIAAVFVTDYYDMEMIDAEKAFFVVGSDVYGPMGRELVAFKNREDAEQFRKDHGGTLILTFGQVKPAVIEKLD